MNVIRLTAATFEQPSLTKLKTGRYGNKTQGFCLESSIYTQSKKQEEYCNSSVIIVLYKIDGIIVIAEDKLLNV